MSNLNHSVFVVLQTIKQEVAKNREFENLAIELEEVEWIFDDLPRKYYAKRCEKDLV